MVLIKKIMIVLSLKICSESDMENARNFTRAGFFIFKFYPNVREIHQIHNREKLRKFSTRVRLSSWERLPSWVGLPRLGNLTHHRMILPLATDPRDNLCNFDNKVRVAYVQAKNLPEAKEITLAALGLLWTFSMSVHYIYSESALAVM